MPIGIPDVPSGDMQTRFTCHVRNLDASLPANIWLNNGNVLLRIPPNYDGILTENLVRENFSAGIDGQGIGGSVSLNIAIFERASEGRPTVAIQQQSGLTITEPVNNIEPDERDVVSVIV